MKSSLRRSEAQRPAKSEAELVSSALVRVRRARGFVVSTQVPMLGRCIDLAYHKRARVTTVEFKVANWRRALGQARDHQLVADYAYICMPRQRVSESLRTALAESGIGLLFYKPAGAWPFQVVVRARRSPHTWAVARRDLRRRVREGSAR